MLLLYVYIPTELLPFWQDPTRANNNNNYNCEFVCEAEKNFLEASALALALDLDLDIQQDHFQDHFRESLLQMMSQERHENDLETETETETETRIFCGPEPLPAPLKEIQHQKARMKRNHHNNNSHTQSFNHPVGSVNYKNNHPKRNQWIPKRPTNT